MVGPYPPLRRSHRPARATAILALFVLAAATAGFGCRRSPELTDLDGIAGLQSRFNSDHGKPRIVLLLSPT